jgi:hypothetical protein
MAETKYCIAPGEPEGCNRENGHVRGCLRYGEPIRRRTPAEIARAEQAAREQRSEYGTPAPALGPQAFDARPQRVSLEYAVAGAPPHAHADAFTAFEQSMIQSLVHAVHAHEFETARQLLSMLESSHTAGARALPAHPTDGEAAR